MTRLTNNPLKVFIHRNSVCIRLKLEFNYEDLFKKNFYKITNKVGDADLILYETCASTHWREDRCVSEIKKLNEKRKKNSKLIICGCMVEINRPRLERLFKNDIILMETFSDFKKILSKDIDCSNIKINNVFVDNYFMNQKSNNKFLNLISNIKISRFHISDYINFVYRRIIRNIFKTNPIPPGFHILISKGCLNNCSYCAIKIAKKVFESKSPDRIREEFEDGLRKGYKEFFLHAEDLGSYGKDIGTSLIELLNKLINYKQDFKINLIGLNMKWLIKDHSEYCKIFDTGKIHRLCIPLQSGNNRILKLMNRGYDIETTKKILKDINKNYPCISLQTHIMVGFPTETISEFKDSIDLINEVNFDYIQVQKFSPRPRTKAYKISPKISEKEMDWRYRQLKHSFRNQKFRKILNYFLFFSIKHNP